MKTTELFGAEAPELDIYSADLCHVCNTKVTSREYCQACSKVSLLTIMTTVGSYSLIATTL